MQLRHYAWVIWRSLWLIALIMCLASGATYVISKFFITPVYQASVLIQVNAAGSGATIYNDQAEAMTLSLLVTNHNVLQAAAQELKNVTVDQLQTAVSASPLDGTTIIQIRAKANDPQQAADIANVVGQDFINIQVTNASTALQSTLQQLTPQLNTAKNNVTAAQTELTALQQERASSTAIERQTSTLQDAQSTYDTLLLNYQQTQQRLSQVSNLLTRVQRAFPPAAPISPNASLDTVIAAALGALLTLVFVFVRDWLNTSIRTPEDVVHLTLLEPLGSVPLSKKPLLSLAPQGALSGDDVVIEQICMIIAMSLAAQQKRAAVLVTSLRPGEGTSTTAANLAISLARSGKRVLLIDANLRHPSLQGALQCPSSKGLVDSLAEIRGLQGEEMFTWLGQWSTPLPNLWLLPAGPATPRSAPVLSSPELRVLMRWLLGQHQDPYNAGGGIMDYVIFDAPSLQEGADAVTLTTFTDHTILVAEAGKEQGEALNKAGAIFQHVGSPVFGVVVNRQAPKHRPYFYVEHAQSGASLTEHAPSKAAPLLAESAVASRAEASMPPTLEERKSRPTSRSLASSSLPPPQAEPYRARDFNSPGTESFAWKRTE